MNYPSLLLSLTGGTREPVTPHVSETRTEQATLRYWRGQSSPTARLPAVTSTRGNPSDLEHLLSYLVGPLIGTSDDGSDHGGTEERDGGATPVETTATQPNVRTSIYVLWGT